MTDEIIEFCIAKWQTTSEEDERIKYFIENKDNFYRGFTVEMKQCIDSFLKGFDYYSHRTINREYKNLHNNLLEVQNVDIDYSVFTILKSQDKSYNSSYSYTNEYKNINGISSESIYPELSDCFDEEWWDNVDNVIFIDDFCGSGKTFTDYLEMVKLNISHKKIFYVVVHMMEKGLEHINYYAELNNLDITVICNHYSEPAFASKSNEKYKEDFEKLSRDRQIANKHIMGFDNTQALVAFPENTPNNTLGLFRFDTEKNTSLFPRKKERKPAFKMKDKRIQRGKNNYANYRKTR